MTASEFDKIRLPIEKEKFVTDVCDPISYAIERSLFDQEKLKRLIAAARQVEGKLARMKIEKWQRMLQRAEQSREHLEERRAELRASKPMLFDAYRQAQAAKVLG
jgi:hypothetical protein